MKTIESIHHQFLNVFATWQHNLTQISEADLLKKEHEQGWTLGQVYNHLIGATIGFHLPQVQTALSNNENKEAKKNFKGFITYHILGKMPPIKINVPASETYTPKQPSSKQEIIEGLALVKQKMENIKSQFANDQGGKTEHPGLSFLNAKEWYQLVGIHFNHHLRQKANIMKANP
jgi:hypothetical protein